MSLRSIAEKAYSWHILKNMNHKPVHIAVIQDGNRRYAKAHGINIAEGHRFGAQKPS